MLSTFCIARGFYFKSGTKGPHMNSHQKAMLEILAQFIMSGKVNADRQAKLLSGIINLERNKDIYTFA